MSRLQELQSKLDGLRALLERQPARWAAAPARAEDTQTGDTGAVTRRPLSRLLFSKR